MRIDLFVPARTVDDVQRFFLKQVKSGGHEVVWTDNEGFEAEVYFRFKDKRIGLVRALITCNDGTIASFEVFDP